MHPTPTSERDSTWAWLCAAAHGHATMAPTPQDPEAAALLARFQPLLTTRCYGHLAQSLDGRIALPSGDSFWISGLEDQHHTHRLRALAHAVIVGAETVLQDDPQLTVRHVPGPQPTPVVLDPTGRVRRPRRIFEEGGPTLLVRRDATGHPDEIVLSESPFAPHALLDALAARGLHRTFVEGGGVTISHFLRHGALDRLHLVVAPVLLGQGRAALELSLGETLATCPRPDVRREQLGDDTLFDLDLRTC